MSSIFYGLTIIFIFVVIFWYIQNERSDAAAASLGILATKAPEDFKPLEKKSTRWSR
jgi:cbb3-type cytochrome oxidase subunit 3